MSIATGILFITSFWHAAAAWHFLIYPARTLLRTTRDRPANPIAIELFRFLGGLNASLALFALLLTTLPQPAIWVALAGFAVTNLSQFIIDWRVIRLGLAHGPMFKTICWGDGLVFVLNSLGAALVFHHF